MFKDNKASSQHNSNPSNPSPGSVAGWSQSEQEGSKRAVSEMEPRITRRMKKMAHSKSSNQDKCAICLGDCQKESGKLTCGHKFCLECVVNWWRNHPTCPYCRLPIDFIQTNTQARLYFKDLVWEEKEDDDQHFIMHCELCWGEIEPFEPMNICTHCRAVYWHRNCLPFTSNKWFCVDCAQQNDEEEDH